MATFPTLIAHADWGSAPGKRWLARAALMASGRHYALAPAPADMPDAQLTRLAEEGGRGPVLVGFDFPIGLPAAYAARVDVDDFLTLLPGLGEGKWRDFYTPAERPEEISLRRPFYPQRPGGTSRKHLLDGLNAPSADDLWRRCDRAVIGRGSAAPLFWTLGPNQVGKAAIVGWRDVLAPALRSGEGHLSIWPFSGSMDDLLFPGRIVAVETYPAEYYHHLGLVEVTKRWSKRNPIDRKARASKLLAWAARAGITLSPDLTASILDGFGPKPDGDDPFDAVVGLFGMLNVALGYRDPGAPDSDVVRRIEGWILGQAAE